MSDREATSNKGMNQVACASLRPLVMPSGRVSVVRISISRLVVGALASLLLTLCVHEGRSEPVRVCGSAVREYDCLLFVTWFPVGEWILPDTLEIPDSGEYFIAADAYEGPPACGHPSRTTYLRNVVAVPCVVESLGCGTIVPVATEPVCYLWASLTRNDSFPIRDLDGFASGDTVLARGILCRSCPPDSGSCFGTGGILGYPLLSACPDAMIPVARPSWGWLKDRYR